MPCSPSLPNICRRQLKDIKHDLMIGPTCILSTSLSAQGANTLFTVQFDHNSTVMIFIPLLIYFMVKNMIVLF